MTSLLGRFRRDAKANVAIIFALAMIPIVSVTGMSIDYTFAGRRQAALNAIADAAALATTTPTAMALTTAQAKRIAMNMFEAQVKDVSGVNFSKANLSVQVSDSNSSSTLARNTVVTYTATSRNAFSGLLHMATMTIGGTSKASNSSAPNIDFYVLLDTSPSMAIPSSQDGINTMVAHTSKQGGCAFACHESNPNASDVAGNPSGEDNYALARQLGIPLRIDLIKQATANLISTAATTQDVNNAQYRVATFTFDANFNIVTNLTSNLTQAASDATNKVNMLVVANDAGYLKPNVYNNDQDTQFDQAMAYSAYLPKPGQGTKASGDSPQEILFLVTDGVADEAYPGVGNTLYTDGSGRTVAPMGYQKDWCTGIKARNIRIAVLYTTYNPLPSNGFYAGRVEPYQASISTTLQACASPGLFFQVNTGGDINSAMQSLFAKAVASAHLTQ